MVNKKWYAVLLCGALFCSSAHAVSDNRSREITRGVVQFVGFWVTAGLYWPAFLCYAGAAASALGCAGSGNEREAVGLGVAATGLAAAGTACVAIPTSLLYYGMRNLWGRELPEGPDAAGKTKTLKGAQKEAS